MKTTTLDDLKYSTGEKPDKNYSDIFLETTQKLAERQNLSDKVLKEADSLVNGITNTRRQHFKAKHMAAAALVVSSRIHGDPRTCKQLAYTLEKLNPFMDYDDHIQDVRRCKDKVKELNGLDIGPVLAQDYISVVTENFECCKEVEKRTEKLMDEIEGSNRILGKSPLSLAAGVFYVAQERQDNDRQVEISEILEFTARNKTTIKKNIEMVQEMTEK